MATEPVTWTVTSSNRDQQAKATSLPQAPDDTDVFALLYEEYLDRVYRYLYARTTNSEDAADLAQQVFLRAFEAFPNYRDQGHPISAWLFKIAHNAVVDFHRRKRPTSSWTVLPEHEPPSSSQNIEEIAIHEDELSHLRQLVANLDQEKRDALALRFSAGLTATEIAHVLGKSEAAVKKQLSRSIRTLKDQFETEGR